MNLGFLRCFRLLVFSVLLGGLLLPLGRAADDVLPQSEVNPTPTFEPPQLPSPLDVPGKEYSDNLDKDGAGNPDPGQVVHWKGDGTTVWDSFDYHIEGGVGNSLWAFETDALANIRDKYFLDLDGTRAAVWSTEKQDYFRDTVSLVVSLQKKPGTTISDGYQNNIYATRSAFRGGSAQLWADWRTNINSKAGALDDLDGLEIHGPGETDDANMYSCQGDPDVGDGQGRVSVFRFHPNQLNPQTHTFGVSVPYLRTATLLNAVIMDGGSKPNWGTHEGDFDVDGLMVWDVNDDDHFGPGDQVLFSIRPVDGLFDGGEIWLCKCDQSGQVTADFLVQGLLDDGTTPRVWNTANQVSMHFFGDDLHGENIDALEAVAPEPSTLVLLLSVGAVLFGWRRLRR
jgi:hypothetical protein